MSPGQRAQLASRYQSDGMAASSPQKLVVLLYERIGTDLATAAAAVAEGSIEAAHKALLNAQDIVFELQLALDVEAWPAGAELRSIYEYLHGLLVEANLQKSAAIIEQCQAIVGPLVESWQDAYRQLQSAQPTPTPTR